MGNGAVVVRTMEVFDVAHVAKIHFWKRNMFIKPEIFCKFIKDSMGNSERRFTVLLLMAEIRRSPVEVGSLSH